MSLKNVFEVAGSPSDPTHDFTGTFAAILANGDSVFVPVRRDGASNVIPYIVKRLSPPSDSVIMCESPLAEIEAGDPNEWIMDLANGVHRLRISGGTWGKNSYGVLRHQRLTEGSLTTSVFEKMFIDGIGVYLNMGFQIGSCAGVMWRDMAFRRIDCYGIHFQLDNGYATTNTADNCRFQDIRGISIYFTHSGDAQLKAGNRISGCWFENSGIPDPQGAIRTKGFHYGLIVERCYFEETGSGSFADIHLEDSTNLDGKVDTVRSVMIRDNKFSNSKESQECRVRNVGRVSYVAMDNDVNTLFSSTLADHQHFASCEGVKAGGRDYKVWLLRNLIHYRGTTNGPLNYHDALYVIPTSVSNFQYVEVEPHPASAGFWLAR